MTALQELLTDSGEYVAPSSKDGEGAKREKRAMIPASRFAWYEKEFHEITKHYDSSDTNSLERRLWALWEKFKGTRR